MIFEELCAGHLIEWGRDCESKACAETECAKRLGYALRGSDGRLVAIGGVRWLNPGEQQALDLPDYVTCIGWVELRCDDPSAISVWVHRQTRFVLDTLAAIGQPVWAIPDPTIPRAEAWLKRLGFAPNQDGVWRRGLGSDGAESSDDGRDRRLDADPGAGPTLSGPG